MTKPNRSLLQRLNPFRRSIPEPRYGLNFGTIIGATDIDISPITTRTEMLEHYAGWVYVCADLIAQDIRTTRWIIETQDGEELPRHPLKAFLSQPNARHDWHDFIEITDKHISTAGETFWHIDRAGQLGNPTDTTSRATGLSIIYPHWVSHPTFTEGRHTGWWVQIPGHAGKNIPRENTIRVYKPHPLDPFLAASPIVAVAASHYFDLYLRAYGMGSIRNDGGVPAGLLSTDQILTPNEAESMREMWRQRYSQQNELAVLGLGVKYQQLGINLADLKFADAAAFTKEQILAAYRIPPPVYGHVADANRANMEAAMETYQRQALKPRLARYESIINRWVLPLINPGDAARFVFEEVVRADRTQDLAEATAGATFGTITINEWRDLIGLEPIPRGEALMPGDQKYRTAPDPATITPADDAERKALQSRIRGLFANWQTTWTATGAANVAELVRAQDAFTPGEFMMALERENITLSAGIDREFFETLKGPVAKRIARLKEKT